MKNTTGESLCDLCKATVVDSDNGMMVHGRMYLTAIAPTSGVTMAVHESQTDMCLACAMKNPFVDKQKLLEFLGRVADVCDAQAVAGQPAN
jgi:hypothetical protein